MVALLLIIHLQVPSSSTSIDLVKAHALLNVPVVCGESEELALIRMADDYGDDFETEPAELESQKKSGGMSLLRSAAAQIDKEEKEEVQAALRESASDMKGVAKLLGDSDKRQDAEAKEGGEDDDEDVSLDGDEDTAEDAEANRALRIACNRGNLTKVRSLVDKGANAKARDRHGWTSLHWACKSSNFEVIDFLIEHVGSGDRPAFLNAKDSISGWTPLMLACMSGKEEAVRSLISRGAKVGKHNDLRELATDFVPATCRARKDIMSLLGVKEEEAVESKEESKH